jgi:nucleotide-binding universal stress UspA family protein
MYSKILVALDGSEYASYGAEIAMDLAGNIGSEIIACHIYGAQLHSTRFREMEPVLPSEYQEEESIKHRRESHKELISDGFTSLSRGYMDTFLNTARQRGLCVKDLHREGRNYVKILELAAEVQADLIVLGAQGLGKVEGRVPGSTTMRVLQMADCDVLVARHGPTKSKILAAIDGSEQSLYALRKAAVWARTFGSPLEIAAAYDTQLHNRIFSTMAESLSAERQEKINISEQKVLHENIIDSGLGKLYQGFLDSARELCRKMQVETETRLLEGKAYRSILDYSESAETSLIVVGRYGHHLEEISPLGSNSEAVSRFSKTNVLVTAKADLSVRTSESQASEMEWEEEALSALQRVPAAVRPMARTSIENHVRSKKESKVTLKAFQEAAKSFGMG